jgi:DNA mismatch repair protein MutS
VLFATHYHEITALRDRYGIINCNVTVKEWNNSVIFLRKIVPGSASKSYGIEVARMAGIPDRVIERAKSILANLENTYGGQIPLLVGEDNSGAQARGGAAASTGDEGGLEKVRESPRPEAEAQLGLFPSPYEILVKELQSIDINDLTPIEALNILNRLKESMSL